MIKFTNLRSIRWRRNSLCGNGGELNFNLQYKN